MVNNTNEALAGRLMKWPRAPTIEVFSFYFCELTEKRERFPCLCIYHVSYPFFYRLEHSELNLDFRLAV